MNEMNTTTWTKEKCGRTEMNRGTKEKQDGRENTIENFPNIFHQAGKNFPPKKRGLVAGLLKRRLHVDKQG